MGSESLVAGLRGAGILLRGSPQAALVRNGRAQLLVDPSERGERPDLDRLAGLFGPQVDVAVQPLAAPAPPSAAVAFVLGEGDPLESCELIRSLLVRARGTKGIQRVDLAGDLVSEVRVLAEADKLERAGLPLAVLLSELELALGQVEAGLSAGDLARALHERRLAESETRLGELATVRPRAIAPNGFARFDGKPAVLMLCRADPAASPDAIRAAIGDLTADLGTLLRGKAVRTAPLELVPRTGGVPFVAALVLGPGAGFEQALKTAADAENRLFGLEGLEGLAVTLKDRSLLLFGRISETDLEALVTRLREIPDVHVRFAPFRDLAGTESPLGFGELIRVRGREADAVEAVAREIGAHNQGLGPPLPSTSGAPDVVAVADPEQVQARGLKLDEVRSEARLALQGRVFPGDRQRVRVVLRAAGDPEPGKVLERFTARTERGAAVPLAEVTRVEVDVGKPEQAFLGADRVVYFSIEDARKAVDLGYAYPGVTVERVHWNKLGTAERALIAAAALP